MSTSRSYFNPGSNCNYDEAKMAVKRSKTTHARGNKKTSERCRHTLHPETSLMKNGAEMTLQGAMAEEPNRDRTTTGN